MGWKRSLDVQENQAGVLLLLLQMRQEQFRLVLLLLGLVGVIRRRQAGKAQP